MSWPVSDTFKAKLRDGSGVVTSRVEILRDGEVEKSSAIFDTDTELLSLEGNVGDDRRSDVRRQAGFTIVDARRLLLPITSTIAEYPLADRDLRLWRGIDDELVPLATVQAESLDIDEMGGITLVLGGRDRSADLAGCDWRSSLTIDDGTPLREATELIVEHVKPGYSFTIVDDPTDETTPRLTFIPGEEPNPWQAITKVWEIAAMEVFLDQLGQIRAQARPDALTDEETAWDFADDTDSLRVSALRRSVRRDSLVNGVVVRATARWLLYGIRGEAWDTDPLSPTYYDPALPLDSPVGPRPYYHDDSLIGTQDQADALAASLLLDRLGIEEQVSTEVIPNPSLASGDIVSIDTEGLGGSYRFVLDQIDTQLGYDAAQSFSTRRRTR